MKSLRHARNTVRARPLAGEPTRRALMRHALAALVTVAAVLPAQASAQDAFPSRPIRLVVAYAPGGPVDGAARIFAPLLSQKLGQQVVVENKPGAGGIIGADMVAKAPPDGYLLHFVASPPLTISPHIQRKIPFDPLKDLQPISMMVDYANVLVVNNDTPARSVPELIAYAKANPGKVTYGSAGVGGSNHLSGELLAHMSGTQMLHIPYKGNNPAMVDVIGGKITMMFDITGTATNYVRGGKVRALAVTSAKRNRSLPEVPTMIESGLAGYDVVGWFGIVGPAALPRPIVDKLNQAARQVLADPALIERLQGLGYEPRPTTPEEFQSVIRKDFDLWGKVVRDAKIERE